MPAPVATMHEELMTRRSILSGTKAKDQPPCQPPTLVEKGPFTSQKGAENCSLAWGYARHNMRRVTQQQICASSANGNLSKP